MNYPSDILRLIISYTPLYDIITNIFETGKKRTLIINTSDNAGDIFKLVLQCMKIDYKEVISSDDQEGDLIIISHRGMGGLVIRGVKRLVTLRQHSIMGHQIVGRTIRKNPDLDLEKHIVYITPDERNSSVTINKYNNPI